MRTKTMQPKVPVDVLGCLNIFEVFQVQLPEVVRAAHDTAGLWLPAATV